MKNLFISESFVGSHAEIGFFEADLLSFTFMPNYDKVNKPTVQSTKMPLNFNNLWMNGSILKKEKNMFDVVKYIQSLNKIYIFIGFDFDKAGDLMSAILYEKLIEDGVNKNNIFRVPLTGDGYSSFTHFLNTKTIEKILLEKHISHNYTIKTSSKLSIRNAIDVVKLFSASEDDQRVININPNKNNTITYLTKKLLRE